jgi:hypothetical protein
LTISDDTKASCAFGESLLALQATFSQIAPRFENLAKKLESDAASATDQAASQVILDRVLALHRALFTDSGIPATSQPSIDLSKLTSLAQSVEQWISESRLRLEGIGRDID